LLSASVRAVPERAVQVHNQRVEVIRETARGRLVAGMLKLGDHDLKAQLAVLDAGYVVQSAPVVDADPVVL